MDLTEVERLFTFWRRHPPAYLTAAAAAGFKPKEEKPVDSAGLGSVLAAAKASGGKLTIDMLPG